MSVRIIVGDCREKMAELEPASVDAIVCDPPYGLEFMGKDWDKLGATVETVRNETDSFNLQRGGSLPFGGGGQRVRYGSSAKSMQAWHQAWCVEAYRVLKPGGHLLAFGGTRTHHRLMVAIEDAGFEIRDCLMWLYGSGFPKSLDVSKAIDKAAGAERESVMIPTKNGNRPEQAGPIALGATGMRDISAPATEAAREWDGWGTALKPAWEPIVMARKPLAGTVAGNVQAFGTGALNIDGCRIGTDDTYHYERKGGSPIHGGGENVNVPAESHALGRWPANVVLDEDAAALLDAQSGESRSVRSARGGVSGNKVFGAFAEPTAYECGYGDTGGASRYFKVVDRDSSTVEYVEEMEGQLCGDESSRDVSTSVGRRTASNAGNSPIGGHGSRQTDLFPMDTKSTIETATNSTTIAPISNVLPPHGTTTTTSGNEKTTEPLTGSSIDGASGVKSTERLIVSSDEPPEPIRGIASTVPANTSGHGATGTGSGTTSTTAPIDSATGNRFWYTAKASRAERNKGLTSSPNDKPVFGDDGGTYRGLSNSKFPQSNHHPTVKPLDLMQWLVRLVTPKGGTVLDPFAGSGSTLVAADREGFHAIGIELDPEYAEIARRRLVGDAPLFAEVLP
jgi:DNA modification methylase